MGSALAGALHTVTIVAGLVGVAVTPCAASNSIGSPPHWF
jgi:hypothetical protein